MKAQPRRGELALLEDVAPLWPINVGIPINLVTLS